MVNDKANIGLEENVREKKQGSRTEPERRQFLRESRKRDDGKVSWRRNQRWKQCQVKLFLMEVTPNFSRWVK